MITSIIPTLKRATKGSETFASQGEYFDGLTTTAHAASLHIDEDQAALVIVAGPDSFYWPLSQIRRVADQAGKDKTVLRLRNNPVARLILDENSLLGRCPNLNRYAPNVRRTRLFGWAAGALASVATIILILVPLMADQLATFIPPDGERALGNATLEQVRTALDDTGLAPLPFCDKADGLAALAKIEQKLTRHTDLPITLTMHVLDHKMVNAFALPGGHVVLFRGLIDAAETPEELASVLAHEIGHVVSRDPTRHALRSAGSIGVLGLLFGDFAGGAIVLFLTERLIQAQYSRAAEAEADTFAHALLSDAKVPPSALGDMFEGLLKRYGQKEDLMVHFLSHPALPDRIMRAQAATPDGFVAEPLLTQVEWVALQSVCK